MVAPRTFFGASERTAAGPVGMPAPLPTMAADVLVHAEVVPHPAGGWSVAWPIDATRSHAREYRGRYASAELAQVALETAYAPPPVMRRVCAWCRADLGVVPCRPEMAGLTTHGICGACAERLRAQLPEVTS